MTKEEATKKLADIIFNVAKSGYIPYDTNDEMCAMNIAKEHIDEFYTSIPSNLDEAAELSANDAVIKRQFPSVVYNTRLKCFDHSDLIKQFKAGAKWMAGQM